MDCRKSTPLDEYFHLAQSNFFIFTTSILKDPFSVECAERYILNGKSAPEMCERNAEIARSLNIPQVSFINSLIVNNLLIWVFATKDTRI